jgi:L-threonylcarbamoyladenylate synthase
MAKNDVQCFKDIPEVAWQIIDLSEKTDHLGQTKKCSSKFSFGNNSLGIRIVKESLFASN